MSQTNWLKLFDNYTKQTESPRDFWLWSGIFTISAALQRKVWLPFGMEQLYPNLYIMIVAEPGWCRKAAPIGLARKLLKEIEIPLGIDSPTKRHLTKRLAQISETQNFLHNGQTHFHASLPLISRELSSFLAVDPKLMIEALTDIYDSHDDWDYGTSTAGEDIIKNLCISCFFASTPRWIVKNLPEEAIGGGFTRRFVIVYGDKRAQSLALPPQPDPVLFADLAQRLKKISEMVGEFTWQPKAFTAYKTWYDGVYQWALDTNDERLHGNFSCIHTVAIKVAICLHVARKDTLIIELEDMSLAIKLLQSVMAKAGGAFSSHGRSEIAFDTDKIKDQLAIMRRISFKKLLRMNYRNVNKAELWSIIDNLETMGYLFLSLNTEGQNVINWVGKGGKKKEKESKKLQEQKQLQESKSNVSILAPATSSPPIILSKKRTLYAVGEEEAEKQSEKNEVLPGTETLILVL